jgi:multiple sugar transport system substrate-binding protein
MTGFSAVDLSGVAWNIYDVEQGQTASYAARGWEADLTEVFMDKLHLIDLPAVKASAIGGKLLNLPYQAGTTCFYFNKSILRRVGAELSSTVPGGLSNMGVD